MIFKKIALITLLISCWSSAREWEIVGLNAHVELKIIASSNGYALVEDSSGTRSEIPLSSFSQADQKHLKLLAEKPKKATPILKTGKPLTLRKSYQQSTVKKLTNQFYTPKAGSELHLSGTGSVLRGSTIHFTEPDGWVFFHQLKPSQVSQKFLDHFFVNNSPAKLDHNIRIASHASGSVIIPHGPTFPALSLFKKEAHQGTNLSIHPYEKLGAEKLTSFSPASLILKRGYMATLASKADGSGFSKNYVAQDHDIVLTQLPPQLSEKVAFIRVFPWRWTGKKGIAGNLSKELDTSWGYNWNLNRKSDLDWEYVPIKQKQYWPNLKQNWKERGAIHLLGFNEPDRPDQANMKVEAALKGWPELMRTGLRLGSPSTSDGGLEWLYEFMDKADKKNLRVDFITVHYYRAVGNPGDGKAAAAKFYKFLKQIHERTQRPLWVTEWNNGAHWTKPRDPKPLEQKQAIQAMVKMLEETDFVERYAPFNWVEKSRELVGKDNSLTPAGQTYRQLPTGVSFQQK